MHDVVVVGAGPTGCYAARELARLGYEVLVLEEHTEVGEPVHCTGIISLEVYRRFDLDPSCIEAYLSSARFVSPSGQSFRVNSPEARAVVVDRRRFDQLLAQQALADGASFLLGARVEGLAVTESHVVVQGHCLGEPVSFPGCLVIIATGTDESLTRQVGLEQCGGQWMFGAQLFAETGALQEVEVHLGSALAPGGFAWAVPANGNGCRVGLLAQERSQELLRRFAQALEARGAIHCNGAEIRCRAVPTGPRRPSYGDRIMVVGDAAGQVKTTTSGGIYYGLLGAEAAVQEADRALRSGDASARQLARYEERWLNGIGMEQRLGRMLRRLYASLSDGDIEALFWLARRARVPRALNKMPFDWHCAGLLTTLWRVLFSAESTGQTEIAATVTRDS